MHARLQARPSRPSEDPQARQPLATAQPVAQRAASAHPVPGHESIANYAASHASNMARAAAGPNRTGLPDGLKTGMEALSGIALDDVRVHRNSARPAQLQALAHTQGSDIHLGPGQERHLAHEAWHVVQQKQGRVRPTMALGGTAINDDAGLEREADTMGARAAGTVGMRAAGTVGTPAAGMPHASPAATPIRQQMPGGVAPVQRFRIVNAGGKKWNVSDDDTAATVDVVNNKDFYATQTRIDQSNRMLSARDANVRLDAVAGTENFGNKTLRKIKPTIDETSRDRNSLGADVSPRADASAQSVTGVQLPSACEKGAISIVGAYLKDEVEQPHPYAHGRHEHNNARIANLLAISPASDVSKQAAYDSWSNLDALRDDAAANYNQLNRSQRVDAARLDRVRNLVRQTDPEVADDEFDANFELRAGVPDLDPDSPDAQDHYRSRTTQPAAQKVLGDMIRVIDERVNRIERNVMSTVDNTYAQYARDVTNAQRIRTQLRALYGANDYPQAVVDEAFRIVGRTDRGYYFKPKQGDNTAYQHNLWVDAGDRMKSLVNEIVGQLDATIVRLEARRDDRFGTVGNRNRAVDPQIGQAYGIIGGGYSMDGGRWNWHWASVVMKTPTDNVTMEAHASHKVGNETHNERWDFKMYGRPHAQTSAGKTFHDFWKGMGFGSTPVTVLGQPSVDSSASAALYNVDHLDFDQIGELKQRIFTFFQIERYFADKSHDSQALVTHYETRIDEMLGLTNKGLPRKFVEDRMHADLNAQVTALIKLRGADAMDPLEAAATKDEVAVSADRLVTSLRDIFTIVESRERVVRRTGL